MLTLNFRAQIVLHWFRKTTTKTQNHKKPEKTNKQTKNPKKPTKIYISWLLQWSWEKKSCVQQQLLPPGPFFLLFLVFFLFESSANASAAFCSLVTKYSMSSKIWFRICYGRKEKELFLYRIYNRNTPETEMSKLSDTNNFLGTNTLLEHSIFRFLVILNLHTC